MVEEIVDEMEIRIIILNDTMKIIIVEDIEEINNLLDHREMEVVLMGMDQTQIEIIITQEGRRQHRCNQFLR
jgi:hypothetical protein